ncbi:hypothetical protein Fot_11389 [Forsythia ovata]|uniref:Uncharacterized protein n=1 Tax=Forsythia ovata TaxID=205694 RepID=A0ABD1WJK4_9LAMI
MPRRQRDVEVETTEASWVGSIRVDETTESLDQVTTRERVDIIEVVDEEAVAALEVERRAHLVARVVKPKEEEEDTAEVFASSRFRLRVSIQNPSKSMDRLTD